MFVIGNKFLSIYIICQKPSECPEQYGWSDVSYLAYNQPILAYGVAFDSSNIDIMNYNKGISYLSNILPVSEHHKIVGISTNNHDIKNPFFIINNK